MPSASSPLKGALAGAVAGTVGTLVLNAFQASSVKLTQQVESATGEGSTPFTDQQQHLLQSFEKAHITTAETAARALGTTVPPSRRPAAALSTEFAFGILSASLYGALAESTPSITAGFGSVFGAVLFIGASEVVLPALGWVPAPTRRTPIQHLGGLAGNIVYGITTEAVRRLLRS